MAESDIPHIEQTDLHHASFIGDVHHPEAVGFPPKGVPISTFSWTDEFLQAMRAASIAAEFGEPSDPEVAEFDLVDNIAVLTNYPGERFWTIYRPNPDDLPRPIRWDLHVTPDMTLADIQRRLSDQWPDLVGGVPDWELILVSPTVGSSTTIRNDAEVFLIKADLDFEEENEDEIVLIESQLWLIADTWMQGELLPYVIRRQMAPRDLIEVLQWTDLCDRTLCPVWANGEPRRPDMNMNVGHGAYIIVYAVQEADRIQEITGDLTNFAGQFHLLLPPVTPEEVPQHFLPALARTMIPLTGISMNKLQTNVERCQITLTEWYRWLFRDTGMKYIRRSPIALFHASDPPGDNVVFMRLAVTFPLNVPVLYADFRTMPWFLKTIGTLFS